MSRAKQIAAHVATFRLNPGAWLGMAFDSKMQVAEVVRVLNAAGFYCKFLDTNHWTGRQVMRLFYSRNNQDLCAELAMVGVVESAIAMKAVRS